MKEKKLIMTIESDVNSVECELTCASVKLQASDDKTFKVEYPNARNFHIGSGESGLFISQRKRAIFPHAKQSVTISVPSHVVPAVIINGKNFNLEVNGGIYGELNLSAEEGKVTLNGCVFENADITGGDLDVHVSEATIKGGLKLLADKGDVLAENTFSTRAEFRLKRGNVGLVNLNCKECTFEAKKGNVTATMTGNEEDFNTSLVTKEGTVNRESVKREGAESSFQAYAGKGNIVLDFTEKREDEI